MFILRLAVIHLATVTDILTCRHHHHHLTFVTDFTNKYETSGIHARMHGSDGCFPTALGRQPTFSNTSVMRIISFSHHQEVVCPWEFKASFGGQMAFLTPFRHGLGERCWKLHTSSTVVEILPPYRKYIQKSRLWAWGRWKPKMESLMELDYDLEWPYPTSKLNIRLHSTEW